MAEIVLGTRTPGETREVGAAIADVLLPGDVVSLTGDLGAGKTTLVQGAAPPWRSRSR
jgi:tRNA threonylcarbamoyladenosine biosynthesis protein TsaE